MPPEPAPPEQPGNDAADAETVDTMAAGLLEHLTGPAGDAATKRIKKAKNPAQEVGRITLDYVKLAAEQAQEAGREVDLDMLLGVATEVAEALMLLAKKAGVKVPDEEQFMAEAIITAVQSYAATVPPGSEEQEAAKAMLAEMQASGMVDQGAAELQRLGKKAGVDPFAQAQQEQPPPQAGLMGAA